jgi:hypothetical protein
LGGTFGVGGAAGAGAIGGVAGMAGAGGITHTCPFPLPATIGTIHEFESVFDPTYGSGIYVYRDTEYDETPWSYGYIFPDTTDDLSAGFQPGVTGRAFELLGYGFTPDSWGAGFGVYTPCIDATNVRGIRFDLKSNRSVRVSINIPNNLPRFDGGECLGDYSMCVQNYVDIPASQTFSYVELHWASFAGGTPYAFDPSRIVGVGFQAQFPGDSFELWVDELAFLY